MKERRAKHREERKKTYDFSENSSEENESFTEDASVKKKDDRTRSEIENPNRKTERKSGAGKNKFKSQWLLKTDINGDIIGDWARQVDDYTFR